MALIKCVECGKDISDKATSCPNCGAPVVQEKSAGPISTRVTKPKSNAHFYYLIAAFALFACAVIGVLIVLLNNKPNSTSQAYNSTQTNSVNHKPSLTSASVESNTGINRVADSKNVSGELKELKYPDGKLQERYYVKLNDNGNYVKNGPDTQWYENDQKKEESTFSHGKQEGLIGAC
jgi:uncharacterized membrane protein YvbJ